MPEITLDQFTGFLKEALPDVLGPFLEDLDQLKKKVDTVDRKYVEDAMRRDFGPTPKPKASSSRKIGRYVQYLTAAKGDPDRAISLAQKIGDEEMVEAIQKGEARRDELIRSKAVLAGDLSSAGTLVPPDMSEEFIELLRADSVFMQAGPRSIPMPNGNAQIPRTKTGTTGGWVGEATDTKATDYKTEMVKLSAKKAFAVVPISNDLLRFTSNQAQELIEQDLVAEINAVVDKGLLRGTGSAHAPEGVRNALKTTVPTAGATLDKIVIDLVKAIDTVDSADVQIRNGRWFMSPKQKWGIFRKLDANNQLSFLAMELAASGSLLGYPVHTTNHIPNTLGGGADESEILFVEMTEALVGETAMLEVEAQPGAAYVDSAGTVRASLSRDVTPIRILTMLDFALRHPEAASAITAVVYGNS